MTSPRFSGRALFNWIATFGAIFGGSLFVSHLGAPKSVERLFYPNGTVASETELNSDGVRDGLHREWYPTGVLKFEQKFTAGDWTSKRMYSPAGELILDVVEGQDYLPVCRLSRLDLYTSP